MTQKISESHLMAETHAVQALLLSYVFNESHAARAKDLALSMIQTIRSQKGSITDIEQFLARYPLTSPQGLALMSLAETLLRVPDTDTADRLIEDILADIDWSSVGVDDIFGKTIKMGLGLAQKTSALPSFLGQASKSALRVAITQMVKHLGSQFVIGETIDSAKKTARTLEKQTCRMSYDMLGEGARTADDAARYFENYKQAIISLGQKTDKDPLKILKNPSVSVKLSALHPRYTWSQADMCVPFLSCKISELCILAKAANISLTLDAEESDRLPLSLDILNTIMATESLNDWQGLGIAVQAYDKRCIAVIEHLISKAKETNRRLQIRLVKGAYWDSEIKRAQMLGLISYPVFTRKINTDFSYMVAAQKMLSAPEFIYPMFATHNVMTAAQILSMADKNAEYEFQRLYGMGADLADLLQSQYGRTVYAPVGSYGDLLPYLVRRMLENGANSSFVSQIRDKNVSADSLCLDPYDIISKRTEHSHSSIPLPKFLYGMTRVNAMGVDLSDPHTRTDLIKKIKSAKTLSAPQTVESLDKVFKTARDVFPTWTATDPQTRADLLKKIADEFENSMPLLLSVLQSEGKKTLQDAIAEVREGIDFARYYAAQGIDLMKPSGVMLNGATGETNIIRHRARGVFVSISPWNFPLAIFCGQIFASLMAGNVVIAKPAEQTPHIAHICAEIFQRAGVPPHVIQLVYGDGTVGADLVAHNDVDGVVFTGSHHTAKLIQRSLAEKDGALIPLIAETGGQNAMIVDTTALPEHVVDDVMQSAFGSAGQRCSALRVLYLPHQIADKIIEGLKGALAFWRTGEAHDVSSDMSSLIDNAAYEIVAAHCENFKRTHRLIAQSNCNLPQPYIAAHIFEISSIRDIPQEVFGPVLHIIRYAGGDLDRILDEINQAGFGLTGGVHSRLASLHHKISNQLRVGNVYINRTMIGAVVGVQPFGGRGLSGTGPKAGGPHYLAAFTTEQVISTNTTAMGGNLKLLTLPDEAI